MNRRLARAAGLLPAAVLFALGGANLAAADTIDPPTEVTTEAGGLSSHWWNGGAETWLGGIFAQTDDNGSTTELGAFSTHVEH